MRAAELASMLARDAERVAEYLLPGGKRIGQEYRAGSIVGGAGESLGVHLAGEKAGVWKDFACDSRGGDLLELWRQSRQQTLPEAMRDAADWLGVQDPVPYQPTKKAYAKPVVKHASPAGKVMDYLSARGITQDTVKAFKVRASEDGEEVLFPYMRGAELVGVKWLRVDRPGGKKLMRMEKDCEPILFGWQTIDPNARSVTICEGEIDAMSLHQIGFPALSVPNGAGGLQWVEGEYPNLDRFDEIYLAFDADEPGKKGAAAVAERLGRDRCKLVMLPHKDANECLQFHYLHEDMEIVYRDARTMDPPELRPAVDFMDAVAREFYPGPEDRVGFDTPWPSLAGKLKFRPSEVVLVNGINGHGKSQVLGHLVLEAVAGQERACIASMEMPAPKWLRRLCMQAGATNEPSLPYLKTMGEWFCDRVWVYDRVGTAKTDKMLEVFAYARRRYGVTIFAIDSLLKCGIGEDDYVGQKRFVEALCDFAMEHSVTIFLVTHSRKMESEHMQADKMDVKGSGSITDLASTVLTVWRNKRKEESPDEHQDEADVILSCQKQRHGDWEGRKWLWFDKRTYQYLETSHRRSVPYVAFGGLSEVSNAA